MQVLMNMGIFLSRALLVAGSFMLLGTSLAADLSTPIFTDANQESRVEYWTFDPLVISASGNQSVSLSVQTSGSPSGVKLVLAAGSERMLDDMGNGRYTTTLTHYEATCCSSHLVRRGFVGRLDLDNGETYKLVINIDDGTIPEVAVLDLDEQTRISPRVVNFLIPRQDPTQLSINEVTRLFYQHFPDEFDFINIVTTPAQYRGTYFINVKNSVQGLGLDLFDHTSTFGSSGRLDGIVHIPTPEHLDLAGLEYLRMLGFNWMNYSDHYKLVGVTPHWPLSNLASGIMGYQDKWSNEHRRLPYYFDKQTAVVFPYLYWTGNYVLKPLDSTPRYSSMELYLMGLLPASDVFDGYVVAENQYQEVCSYCVIEAPFFEYTVDDLRALHGARVPDHSKSRRNFKAATIVVSNDRLLSPQEVRFFDRMAARGEGIGEIPYSFDNIVRTTNPFRTATRDNRYGYDSGEKASFDAVIVEDLEHRINESLNGAWYDPYMPGQGFFVNVFPVSKRMFIGWFTYDFWRPNVRASNLGDAYHRWMTASGEFSGNRAELVLYKTTGGIFNSETPTENSEIGKLVFKLNDCGKADIEYDIPAIDFQGQATLQRIANDNVSRCEDLRPNPASMLLGNTGKGAVESASVSPLTEDTGSFQINAGLNDAWFNPDWPGQGFFIDVLPETRRTFVGWFTFDTERLHSAGTDKNIGDLNQRWLTAIGNYQGSEATLGLQLTSGGLLLEKKPIPSVEDYGSMQINFTDCETATVQYRIPTLEMEGVIPLKRVSDENVELCKQLAAIPQPPAPSPQPDGPVLYYPINDQVIEQNNPNIGCEFHPQSGYGLAIDFDWSDIEAHSVRYHLIVKHTGAAFPVIDTFTSGSSYYWIGCNSYVLPRNLQDWVWHVQAHITRTPLGPETLSEWSEDRFRFERCTFSDGSDCSAANTE